MWTPEGVLVEGGVPRGPVAGEAWHRLSEALLALLDEPPAAQGDELTVAVGGHRVVARVAARHPVATRLAEARASVDRWADATTIDLSGRAADAAALVARVERAIGVQRLLLGATGATDAVVRAIVDSDRLATVEALDLHDNPEITDASVVPLVSSPAARKLRHLSLGWTSVTRATARAILDSPLVDALAWLDLRRTRVHVDAEDWVDQGAVIGNTPRDDEVDELVARFGARVLLR